ncbi:Protein FAM136A [Plasmodiophora brassicae]|nr:hypothetical protein PBRA_004867 [Plasmodiophora brassicae]
MAAQAQQEQAVLQRAVDGMIKTLDREHLRPLQKGAYMCMAECLDNVALEGQSLQACMQSCTNRMDKMKHVVEQEMDDFQQRVQRGLLTCNDEGKDRLGTRTDPESVAKAQKFVDECAAKSLRSHMAVLDAIQQRIQNSASQLK